MKIVSIVGARPQFVKLAEICRHTEQDPAINHYIIHTGQHYDYNMSQVHIDQLAIPTPDRNLGVNGGTNTENIAIMMLGIEKALKEHRPDIVLVYGDTDSTVAGAMVACKLHIKLAHVEAGARSGDPSMHEEVNRILVDSISDLLLYSSRCQMNLPIQPWQTGVFVGDLMLDCMLRNRPTWNEGETVRIPGIPDPLKRREYYYMTLHRAETIDDKKSLQTVLNAIGGHLDHQVFLSAHPRLLSNINKFDIPVPAGIVMIPPQEYRMNIKLIQGAKKLLTDSGGMQREAFWLKTPCVTLRDRTEWPETLNFDRNIITGIDRERIRQAIKMYQTVNPKQDSHPLFGSGLAGHTLLNAVRTFVRSVSA